MYSRTHCALNLSANKDLAYFLRDWDMPPFFALPWFITWFSHNVNDLNIVARLFDVFMGSHPLLPLYVSASVSSPNLNACGGVL